jgi:hypothetical protein
MIDNIGQLHHNLDKFVSKWKDKIYERCESNQKKAAFFVWVRYFTAIRSLHHLRDKMEIADCYTIARCCLELDVSFQAICQYSSLGDDYMEYEKHAKNRYLELLKKTGSAEEITLVSDFMTKKYGSDYEKYRWDNWCSKKGGITGLFKLLGRDKELRLYAAFSHFAHGSIIGLQLLNLQAQRSLQDKPNALLKIYLGGFMTSSNRFLGTIWGLIITPESEQCYTELKHLLKGYLLL